MKIYDKIEGRVEKLINNSKMFFVGSAPMNGKHINLSPKGLQGTLKITGEKEVMYLESHGSGCETISHLRENGRIVLMFCSFEGDPIIARIHGHGSVVLQGTPEFETAIEQHFQDTGILNPKACRSVIKVKAFNIMDSCGYAVPLMTFNSHRTRLPETLDTYKLGFKDVEEGAAAKYLPRGWSLDGLPGAGIEANRDGCFFRSESMISAAVRSIQQNAVPILFGSCIGFAASTLLRKQAN
eukprot:TRINITY_DN8994_c0_g1_i1.p1 TRINITY_DN8994_c0_g1~~TRINITY_DN8994_c0_g1_i1.p1  ORF type:complete len:240 (+),score=48.22 TRINITY_DN8994_c0_g1_i1:106-825(+)